MAEGFATTCNRLKVTSFDVIVIDMQKSRRGHVARMKRSLKSSPDVVTIGMVWDSAKPDETVVASAMKAVDCSIQISCVSFVICVMESDF